MYAEDRKTMLDRRELLKIKLKSLAAEQKIIRQEERKTHGLLREEMWHHRTQYLRKIARDTHIAYGLIRGRTWAQIEPKYYTEPNWDAIKKMIAKYGPRNLNLEPLISGRSAASKAVSSGSNPEGSAELMETN